MSATRAFCTAWNLHPTPPEYNIVVFELMATLARTDCTEAARQDVLRNVEALPAIARQMDRITWAYCAAKRRELQEETTS